MYNYVQQHIIKKEHKGKLKWIQPIFLLLSFSVLISFAYFFCISFWNIVQKHRNLHWNENNWKKEEEEINTEKELLLNSFATLKLK